MKKQSNLRVKTNRIPEVVIYTDGACSGNPGPGGWGAILIFGEHAKEMSGGEQETTNNRMELAAAIQALEVLRRRCAIDLFTDSTYVKNGITQWLPRWKKNNWIRGKNQPVRNADLWKRLDQLNSMHDIHWKWVASHSGNEGNERADELARSAIPQDQDSSNRGKRNA